MAAKTPETILRESMGSLTLHIASFADLDDGDTWASKIPGVVSAWGVLTKAPAASSDTGLTVSITNLATGQLTFWLGDNDLYADVFVMSRS